MTIDRAYCGRWIAGAGTALGVWLAGLLAMTFLIEPTAAVMVVAPGRQALQIALQTPDVALWDGSDRLIVVEGTSPGFVRRLYASGAWLVLPARGGCAKREAVRT